ncbi:alkaline phosphatase [Streptosporangium sp. NPDC004379]|uniref:alkaline phosphatase n=1 Tax=Streptosporangium sp. NPDC004379 TaxID=3366189 RepID=UPI0036A3B2D7
MLDARSRRRRTLLGAGLAASVLVATGVGAAGAAPLAGDRTDAAKGAIQGGRARNVILFVGDGMGDSEITMARNYAKGADGRLNMDMLPLTGAYTTYSLHKDTGKPDYVTDSSAGATGWATGTKTYNGAISVDRFGRDLPTVLELAQKAGYVTGDVTTAELTDSTPAAIAAHVPDRSCQGPADMKECPQDAKEKGGPGSIAEQLVDHGVDVLMGGGKRRFDQTVTGGKYTGQTVLAQAQAQGYTTVFDSAGLTGVRKDQKVLGLFSPGIMPPRWNGPAATPFTAEGADNTVPQPCPDTSSAPAGQPTLERMTAEALRLLDAKAERNKDGRGFFLQVEGAGIDLLGHVSNPCSQIGETVGFDDAIALGRAYAAKHPDTLVIVTADHAHASQIVEYPQTAGNHSAGGIRTLLTTEGAPMVISYATNAGAPEAIQGHTGSQVRVAAQGPQAANVLGITNQTDLFHTMSRALGLR